VELLWALRAYPSTVSVPAMPGWIMQTYFTVPAFSALNSKVPSLPNVSDSKSAPSSAVTLCVAETYSVLTRLPGDARPTPADAALLIEDRFGAAVLLGDATAADLPGVLRGSRSPVGRSTTH